MYDVPAFAQHTFECKHSLTIWCNVDYDSCSDFYIQPFSKISLKSGGETISYKMACYQVFPEEDLALQSNLVQNNRAMFPHNCESEMLKLCILS